MMIRAFLKRSVAPLLGAVLASSHATAQPRSALVSARSLRCFEGRGYAADWSRGTPTLKAAAFPSRGESIQFDAIDRKAGRARLIGNAGTAEVTVIATAVGLHFIEETAFGNLNVTTVFAQAPKGVESGAYPYVGSRHVSLLGNPLPSQYHGICKVWE